jgi:hypothetical protein
VLRKTLLLVVAVFVVITPLAARAQTNYPIHIGIEVRDANGNLITADTGLHVGDIMNIVSDGWFADSDVTFTFFSDPILLGVRKADAQGIVRAQFAVPNVEPGMHTLRLTGTGADGKPRTVDFPIKVIGDSVVAGKTLDNVTGGATGSATGSSAFGKTGAAHAREIAAIGFALFAVGAALVLAVRRTRASHLPA